MDICDALYRGDRGVAGGQRAGPGAAGGQSVGGGAPGVRAAPPDPQFGPEPARTGGGSQTVAGARGERRAAGCAAEWSGGPADASGPGAGGDQQPADDISERPPALPAAAG